MTLRPYSPTIQANFRDVMQTPAAPEAFDDQTPLVPTIDVSLQKDTESVLQVAGKSLSAAVQTATNATTTLFTAGSNGARLHAFALHCINGAGNGNASVLVNGVAIYTINLFNNTSGGLAQTLATNFILIPSGQVCAVVSPNVNVTATASVQFRQL